MAKIITDVLLKDGVDETTFINDVTSNDEVDLFDRVTSLTNMVVLNVEESYLETLQSHSSVLSAEFFKETPEPVTYPSTPSTFTQSSKTIGGTNYYTTVRGDKYLSLQHYSDTDIMQEPETRTILPAVTRSGGAYPYSNTFIGNNVGNAFYNQNLTTGITERGEIDQVRYYGTEPAVDVGHHGDDQTYYTTYTGKHVDIVVLEGGDGVFSGYENYHDNHPDFQDPDVGGSRMIAMNWPGLSSSSNNQVSSNNIMNGHVTGTLSVSGGLFGGFAKRSSLRACHLVGNGITSCLNSIKSWHQSKSNNSETGFPNPTIIVTEWHHPTTSRNRYVKVDDVAAVTDSIHGTTNRPGSGWGSDLTPFVLRHLIPMQVRDPIDSTWNWCIGFAASQATYLSAIEQCWDAGIHIVTSGGNGCAVYCQTTAPEYNGTYLTMNSGNYNLYSMLFPSNGNQGSPASIIRGLDNATTIYALRPYGPGGLAKSINVAAGQNSEGAACLDGYSSRGPGVDLIGRGSGTWSCGSIGSNVMADGYRWSTFGGTSCAMPTVAGKLACYIEKHYTINGVYPTPDQAKASMIAEAKNTGLSVATTTWSNVSSASGSTIDPKQHLGTSACLKVESGVTHPNGGTRMVDLAGTPPRHAYWNAQNFNREQTYKQRPRTGVLFPRPRKFDIPPSEEAAEFY
mgnify:CR=1 FL=1